MRKTVVFVAVLLLSLLFAWPAYAAEWNIPELDMKISVPEGWIVFTRNMDKNDPNLKTLPITYDELMKAFETTNTYFNASQIDHGLDLTVNMSEDASTKAIGNFNRLDENKLKNVGDGTIKAVLSNDIHFNSCSIYKHGSIIYLFFDGWKKSSPQNIYMKQYSTIVNGRAINIVLLSYMGPTTPEYSDALRSIVDSIEFDEVAQKRANLLGALAGVLMLGLIAALIFIVRAAKMKKEAQQIKSGFPDAFDVARDEESLGDK